MFNKDKNKVPDSHSDCLTDNKSLEELAKAISARVNAKNWFSRMSPLLSAHRRPLIVALVSAMAALVVQVAVPRVMMEAIDKALVVREKPLLLFVLTIAILALCRSGAVLIYRYLLFKVAYLIEFDLRALIFRHINRMSFSFFDRIQSGQIISRANSDIRAVQMYMVFAPFILLTMANFFIALGLMLSIHVKLALASLLPLPLVYLVAYRMRQHIFPLSWIVQSRLADLATIVEENISGVRVVKSFAAEKDQIGKLTATAERLRWASVKLVQMRAFFAPVMENLPKVATAIILFYGGYLTIHNQVTIGTLVAFSAYVILLQTPFRLLGMLMMLSQRSAASAHRIFEILDEQPEVMDNPGAEELSDPEGKIAFKGVSFSYRHELKIIDNLSFSMTSGETIAVVGGTGSGKTTLARLLLRFYDVDEGAILIDGRDIRDFTCASLRSNIGIVFEEPVLFSASIRDNIAYGKPEASFQEITDAAAAAEADEFIRKLSAGYDTVIGERGYTLSGGQRQRIAIARTLLAHPGILILDDATSSVDATVELRIHNALRELMKNRSTFIIAHRLSTISLADRVILMEKGKVTAQGTHDELMRTVPRYGEILARTEEEKEAKRAGNELSGVPEKEKSDTGFDLKLEQALRGMS